MSILASALAAPEQRAVSLADLLKGTDLWRSSASGKSVTMQTAIRVSTVMACVRVIAEGVAQVPWKLMRQDGRKRLPQRDNPLYSLLATSPNAWQTSFEFREMMVMNAALAGNAFAYINRSLRGEVLELIPIEPQFVEFKLGDDFEMRYTVRSRDEKTKRQIPAESMWHIRGPSINGWSGLDAVKIAREAIGLGMAIEDSQSAMHANGVRPAGMYSVDGSLSGDQHKALAAWIEENHGGPSKAGKAMILDRGAKWISTAMTGVDAQTLETRRYQVEEVCRFFRVNPIMVGAESKNTTYASAEQMFRAHLVHTLAPWFTRIEQSGDKALLTQDQRRQGYYTNFVEEGLLRGSVVETKDVLLGYVNGGIMTPNEARDALDLNPDSDSASDGLRIPANITGAVQ